MNVTLKQVISFEVITEDGRSLGNFERVSTWEGFDKLASPSGHMIIVRVNGGAVSRAFSDLLGSSQSAQVIGFNPAAEKALSPPSTSPVEAPFEFPDGTIRFPIGGGKFRHVLPTDGSDEQASKEYRKAEEIYSLEGAGQKLINGKWTDLPF